MGITGKWLTTSLSIKAKTRPKRYKKAGYSIVNISKKDLSRIIRKFEKFPYKSYENKRPKHEPAEKYFYPARQLTKCMMSSDDLNSHVYPIRTETTPTKQISTLHIFSTYKSKLKELLVDETLL